MEYITEKEVLKINLLNTIKHHVTHCDGEECNVSLFRLYRLGRLAGLDLLWSDFQEAQKRED